jgi:putative selenium metabolism hydrolase
MASAQEIRAKAEEYGPDMFRFLRDIVAIRSFDGEEKACIARIAQEMKKLGFENVHTDGLGNLMGTVGHGSHLIAIDGHCDTVSFGDAAGWSFDPLTGMEDNECIGGRGSTDQKGGIVSMLYAGKLIQDLNLTGDYTLLCTASVQEENCDGLCWQYIIEQDKIRPEFAVLTEPSDGHIRNGQRGRMEIGISTKGVSCHGSIPDQGVNAVYKMAPIIDAVKRLHESMTDDGVLGKGSVTISQIFSESPSRCAVADGCTIALDRRLNSVESPDFALDQLRALPEVKAADAKVFLFRFDDPSYTGLHYPTDLFFPAWIIDKTSAPCAAMAQAFRAIRKEEPDISPWSFSTNGTAIMGRHGIPCVGFGPGHQALAHAPNEKTWKQELIDCCAVYAALPLAYLGSL